MKKTVWSLWALTAAMLSFTACGAEQLDVSDAGRSVFIRETDIPDGCSEEQPGRSPPGNSGENSAESTQRR